MTDQETVSAFYAAKCGQRIEGTTGRAVVRWKPNTAETEPLCWIVGDGARYWFVDDVCVEDVAASRYGYVQEIDGEASVSEALGEWNRYRLAIREQLRRLYIGAGGRGRPRGGSLFAEAASA
jgi:hypothetical protein